MIANITNKKTKNIFIILFFFMIYLIIYSLSFAISIENKMAVDSFGNKVPLKKYDKIIVCDPSAVEIFYLIGGEVKISAIAKTKINKIYPEEKTKELISVGTITKPSIEKIIELNPDLIILNPMATKIEDMLKQYKIPYFIDRSVTFEEIFLKTKIYGIFTEKEIEAENLIKEKQKKIEEIKRKAEKENKNLKGIILYSSSPMVSFASDTIPAEVFKILNIKNLAEKYSGTGKIFSSEMILKENPDIIIGTMKIKSVDEIIENNQFLKYSKAYKNNSIYVFESDKILRATPRIADGIEEIYTEIYKEHENGRK